MRHVPEGEIEGLPRVHRQCKADQTSAMRIEESILHAEGQPAHLAGPHDQRLDIVRLDDQMATHRRRPVHSHGRRTRGAISGMRIETRIGIRITDAVRIRSWSPTGCEALHETAEFHLGEEPVKPGTIRLSHPQRLKVQIDVEIGHERHELFREADFVGILHERLPYALGGNVARVLENLVDAPVLIEKLEGRLGPNATGSRDVVRGVADQCQVVDYLGRRNTELFVSISLVHPFSCHTGASAPPWIQEVDAGPHELIEILVAGNDDGLESRISRLDREGTDHIISLVTVQLDEGIIKSRHKLSHTR